MTDPSDARSRAIAGIANCPNHQHWTGERYDALVARVEQAIIRTARRPPLTLPPEIAAQFGRDASN